MAESERAAAAAAGDEGVGAEVLDGGRQTELCPNCRQPYSWMCGEDAVPTSLSCGHSLCFRCAKSQWRSPGSEESPVLCASCSTPVTVSTYKPVPLTRPEGGPPSSMKAGDCDPAALDDTDSGHTQPVTITPTHLPSASEVVLTHSSERKQSSSAGCPVEKVASTLSSPLVLDKIQSQDDAWRLLQHDEGFIRDWIVANVPDHVIFKMVGVGSSDSGLDSSSLVLSNGNTVVITSPPKTEDVTMATPETAGPTSTVAGPGAQGDSVVRASFEQHFLHYLVSKATPADKPTSAMDVSREHGLPETLTTVDSAAQTGPEIILEDRGALASSSSAAAAPDNKSMTMEMLKQGLKHLQCAGEESKVSVFHMEKSSQLPNGMIEDQTSPLGSDIQTHVMQSVTSQSAEAEQYPSGLDPSQSVLALQPIPPPDYKSCLPTANISYHPASVQNPYQENCASQMFGNSTRGMTRFPHFPAQRDFQPPDSGVFAGPHHRMYGSYSFMYSHPSHPSWMGQGLPRYPRMPQRFQPGPFQRCPQYMPHHGERFGRDGGPAYPPSVQPLPSECSWSSKACTTALNPPPPSTVSSQPQIRFVQVVRPKPDLVSVPELPRVDGDAAPSMGRVDEAMGKEPSTTNSPGDREAEVALMKTRNMPHGTQVEDIYVVPQVWLNGGGGPSSATELMQQNESPAGPYPEGSPHRPFAHPAVSKFAGDQETGGPASQKSSEKSAAAGVYNNRLLNHLVTTGFAGPDVNSLKREQVPETSDTHEAPEKAVGCMSENSEEASGSKDNDYTGFKPVAVVTTFSVSKPHTSSAARTETTAPERRGLPVPPLPHSSTATTTPVDTERAASGWTPSIETPVRDPAMIMDGVHGKGSVGQVPPAPIKKMDGHLEWKHTTQNVPFGLNAVEFSRQNGNESGPSLSPSSHITGPCNKTAHDALMLEMSRCAEADTQTAASTNEVEIIEDKSSLPSTIMLPRQKPAQVSYNRKRFRRNLSSEFHNSDIGIRSSYHADQPAERRTYSRSGRPFSSKYSQYSSVYGSPPHAPYAYPYPYSHGPRPYYYSSYANTPSTALRYRHPCPYPEFFPQPSLNKPSDYQFGVPVDEVPALAPMYPLLHRSASHAFPYPHVRPEAVYPGPASQTAASSLPQPFPDVLSHLSSGRGDFSNTSSVHVQPKASLISPQDISDAPKANAGCSSEDNCSGSGIRQLRFWPDRQESGGTGDGDGFSVTTSASHHRVSLQDLETVHWIQHEIRELNKELDSSVLTQLEGCLALLEKSAHQVHPVAVTTGPSSQNLRDRDHLWRCILTLGKAVVQYGWWCQPHHWDGSSQRWAEMAMLASDVFTHSMHSLIEVIIFYLDHALTTVTGDDGQVEGDFPDQQVGRVLSDDAFRSVDVPEPSVTTYRQQQARASVVQSDYATMLAKGQCPEARGAVAQLAYSNTAGDSSQTQVPGCHQQQGFPSSVGTDRPMNTVTVDPPESYIPHPSTFSHYGEEGIELPQPGDADLSQVSFAVEDRSLAGREQEAIPSVVYHYQVSGMTEETRIAEYGRALQRARNVDLSFQERSAVWTPGKAQHSHRGSGQFFDTEHPGSGSVEQPGLPTDTSSVVESVHDRDRATTIVMTSPAVNQTQMEVYYTVEGESLMDGMTSTTQAPCDSEERKCAESVVYAVSHLMKVDNPSEELDSTVSYILSAEVDESPRQQPETQDSISMKTELTNAAKAISPSHDSPPHNPQESCPRPEDAKPATDSDQQNQGSSHSSEMSSKDVNMVDGETVLHSDQTDVNVFMVTVPADRATSRDVECSGQEVISDTAIMLSETVEIETDGTLEVNGVKQAESSRSPPAKEGCPDTKENINSSSYCGKRKRTRTPQPKNKHLKQDLSHEKPSGKGTLAVKSGKWNLRSSRGSATEGLHSK